MAPDTDHRTRLLDALASVLETRSFAEVTIADIVSAAHVSRRTFYEHFDSKEALFLALCEHESQQVLRLIVLGFNPLADWVGQLEQLTRTYLRHLQQRPGLLKALYLSLMNLGEKGLAVRRAMATQFAQFLILQVEFTRTLEPRKRPLSPVLASAIVGGINELILQAIEQDEAHALENLTPTVNEFIQAVLKSLEPQAS